MRFFLTMVIMLMVDQLSKYWVVTNFNLGEKWTIIEGILSFTYIHNPGAAFGLMEGKIWFFIFAAFMVVAGMIYYDSKYNPPDIIKYALGLIAGGALGNLVDRIFYKSVIDFISVGWWPVFNIADIGIVVGSIVIFIFLLYQERGNGA
ncbi:signal peptidase II [Thermosyntropha sp.]|uniref:signal peptidase II n=1 Tax=Thermosyntropha sp. TaxID=2740820 RepID=UPI0025D5F530|nr:signal peptidase II [Thermosyntropha sp.]MBO8159422.1 signal peptidase II [Thermosyntropha sp.]